MTLHDKVIEAFLEFRRATGARMRSVLIDEDTAALVGYGWAVYAVKFRSHDPNRDDRTIVFRRWAEYSKTSAVHIGKILWKLERSEKQLFINYVDEPEVMVYSGGKVHFRDEEFMDELRFTDDLLYYRTAGYGEVIASNGIRFEFQEYIAAEYKGKDVRFYKSSSHEKLFDEIILGNNEKAVEFLKQLILSDLPNADRNLHFDFERLRKTIKRYQTFMKNRERGMKLFEKEKAIVRPAVRGFILLVPEHNGVTAYHLKGPDDRVKVAKVTYNRFYRGFVRGEPDKLKGIMWTEIHNTGKEIIMRYAKRLKDIQKTELPDEYKAIAIAVLL